jgi:putative oxidoreductase
LRLITGIVLIHSAIASVREAPPGGRRPTNHRSRCGDTSSGGLWTPVAGALAAIVKVWLALSRYFSHSGDPWIALMQAALGAVLAMVGPGAWSVDARLFGRKHIDVLEL